MKIYPLIVISLFCLAHDMRAQWIQTNSPKHGGWTWALTTSGVTSAVSTDSGIYLSTDDGITWVQQDRSFRFACLQFFESDLFAGTSKDGLFHSTDSGRSWN